MAKFQGIHGPFATHFDRWRVTWQFAGIREDGSFATWRLSYNYRKRQFITTALETSSERHYARAMSKGFLTEGDTNFSGPFLVGKVTDLLRSRLPKEDIARAIAHSIFVTS